MKGLFATAIMLTFAASVWAQGQIVVTGSESLEAVPFKNIGVIAELPVSSLPESSDWLPPSQRSSGVEMIEASRTQSLIDISAQPTLPPTPDFQTQINQAGVIEPIAAPEPSTLALGGLAAGLIALTRFGRRQQVLKR